MPVREWPADSIEAGIAQCVTACDALVTVSEDCADACLATEGNDGPTAVAILETCREACMASTAACERMMALHPSWQTCSMACRRVSDSCTRLLALLGHREE